MTFSSGIIVLLLSVIVDVTQQTITSQHASRAETNEMTLFLRFEGKDSLHPIDISAGATSQDLYDLLPESSGTKQLFFQNKAIRRDDIASLGDLGIGAQSQIDVHPESEAVGLYHLVNNLENKEAISWFADAEFCADDPRSDRCTVDAICGQWLHHGFIMCRLDDPVRIIEVIEIRTSNTGGAHVGGCLSLKSLPKTVVQIVGEQHELTGIDLTGLQDKDLVSLILRDGRISKINFADFEGSSVSYLDLTSNLLQNVNLGDIIKSKLKFIDLSLNRIQSFTFTQQEVKHVLNEGEPRQDLYLDGNPLDSASQARWKYLQFRVLHARNELNRYHVFPIMCSDTLFRNSVSAVIAAVLLGVMGRMWMWRN